MAETHEPGRFNAGTHRAGAVVNASDVNAWFVREVLPLEPILMTYLRHHWPDKAEIEDLRQEVYARVHEAARKEMPSNPKPFVFAVARNLLINQMRRENVVPIEALADLEALDIALDAPSPDRSVIARDELRRLQSALDQLPPRCREAVVLGRVEGLTGREIATRMNIGTATVSEHLENGMRLLAKALYGDEAGKKGSP
jgi:RNA polymerase sigma-70 factor (ECF subfamily)